MKREWTELRSKTQSELLKKIKPWTKSTGAKSIEGKKISSMNAYNGGSYEISQAKQAIVRLKILNINEMKS